MSKPHEIVLDLRTVEPVSLGEEPEAPPVDDPQKRGPGQPCSVCISGHRDVIEALVFNGKSFNANSETIREAWGLNISPKSLRTHMRIHTLPEVREQFSVYAEMAKGYVGHDLGLGDSVPPLHVMLELLTADALSKVARGDVTVRGISDALKLASTVNNIKAKEHDIALKNRQLDIESGTTSQTADDMMRQLGYIMTAIKTHVDESTMVKVIEEARALGLGEAVASLGEQQRLPGHGRVTDYVEADYSLVVRDVEKYGRPRTRAELEEAGVFDGVIEVEPVSVEDVPPGE